MPRVFVFYHAGEVYERDSVRWYSARGPENIARLLATYHNIGDSVVYDSTLKLLDFDELVPLDPNALDEAGIEWINATCDYGIIRGSNYLHSEMEWGNLEWCLDRIKVPICAPGIGMQAPLFSRPQLSPTAQQIIRALARRSVSLGVRGDITAQLLWDTGVKNVRIVGCPSMFRSLRPSWELDDARLDRLRTAPWSHLNVALTVRREIGPDYVDDVPRYLAAQRRLIEEAFAGVRLQLFAQGELFEKFYALERADLYEPLIHELIETGWATDKRDSIFRIYKETLFYTSDIPAFARQLAKADLATGFRVHGVLPSLAQGIPGVLINYDKRTQELIDTFGIPSVTLERAQLGQILRVAQDHDYGRIARRYAQTWVAMRDFLDENGIPHRMRQDVASMTNQPVTIITPPTQAGRNN